MDVLKALLEGKDQLFYSIHDKSISYHQMYEKVLCLSDHLTKLPDQPIIIYGHKQIEVVMTMLSCLQARRTYIMVDSSFPINRVKEIITLSNASMVIAIDPLDVEGIVCKSIEEVLEIEGKTIPSTNHITYILYTSGSTGKPKGVPISYKNLEHFIKSSTTSLKVAPLNILSVSNFSFDLSLMDLYYALYLKCSIIGVDKDNKSSLALMKPILQDIHYIVGTPTYLNYLLLDKDWNANNHKNLKYIFSCGERLEVDTARKLKERFPDLTLINAYGPTEATCFVSYHIIDEDDLHRELLPVGNLSSAFVDIYIQEEEIVLRGKSVFSGYLNQPCLDSTNNEYIFPTGDLGYIEDDLIYLKQRKDHQIKYQGYRIELSDIEINLLKIDGIDQACVVTNKKGNQVKMIKAYVTGDLEDDRIIKQKLKEYLPAYMIPKRIIHLNTMPMNANGKINRKELEVL